MNLTVENILKCITQEDIIARYFPYHFDLRAKYKNPFRIDNNAGCYFKYSSNGKLMFYDNAQREYGGDCFKIAMLATNLKFYDCLKRINKDFNLNLTNDLTPLREDLIAKEPLEIKSRERELKEQKAKIDRKTHFRIIARNWERIDYKYWYLKYGITFTLLKKYNIVPVKEYALRFWDSTMFKSVYDFDIQQDPCYCYQFFNAASTTVKLYRPLCEDRANKWKSNVSKEIQGYSQLPDTGDILFITSSMKDALILISNGFNAIAPQSEGLGISKELFNELSSRFTKIIYCYDNDKTGINNSIKLATNQGCDFLLLSYFIDYFNELINSSKDPVKLKDLADIMAFLIESTETITEARKLFKSNLINSLSRLNDTTAEGLINKDIS